MHYYSWIFIAAVLYLLVALALFTGKVLPSKWKVYIAPAAGRTGPALRYSFTGAMSPSRKESAYLHLPTYSAGLLFHIALFTSACNLALSLSGLVLPGVAEAILSVLFAVGALCGLAILFKRIASPLLRSISNPDDYFSNLLVTGFLVVSLLSLHIEGTEKVVILYASLLLLYLPLGKLRHSFFFFSSRIALGIYYGRRGVWKAKSIYR